MAALLSDLFDWNDVWLLPVSFLVVTILASMLLHYGRVGIGVMKGGPSRLMITQNFRN